MQRSPLRPLIALAVVLIVGGLVWKLVRGGDGGRTGPEVGVASIETQAPATTATALGDETEPGEQSASPGAEARVASQPHDAALAGRVVDESAAPVAGAEVTWTALLDLSQIPPKNWSSIDWSLVEASTRRCASDRDGRFYFDAVPPGAAERGSVLWITHPGHRAQPVLLGPDRASWPTLTACVVHADPALRVRVIDAAGAAAAGARVRQIGLVRPRHGAYDPSFALAHRLYVREWTTSESGELLVPAFEGTQAVLATRGELEAQPWLAREDTLESEIVLQLAPTFVVTGRVRVVDGQAAPGELHVAAFSLNADAMKRLAQVRVSADLSFGPLRLPSVAATSYLFELTGGGLAACERRIEPPVPGAKVHVEFEARPGHELDFVVLTEQREPIPGAEVSVTSLVDGALMESTAETDQHGRARVRGCGQGDVQTRASAVGFMRARLGPILVPQEREEPIEFVLAKAGVIEGTCTREGQPVRDFRVLYWQRDPYEFADQAFWDRSDGSFRIDDAPLGQLWILASAAQVARGEQQQLEIAADRIAKVVLELPRGATATGRVVDAVTGEGIAGAAIRLWSNVGPQILTRTGPRCATEADGSFRLAGFPSGDARFEVEADGYALVRASAVATGEQLDLGLLPLARRQTLEVRLRADGARDLASYRLSLEGPEAAPHVQFDSQGVARAAGLAPGRWGVGVHDSAGNVRYTEAELVPGADWIVEVPLGRAAAVTIEVEPEPGLELPPDLGLRCMFVDALGCRSQAFAGVPPSGVAELDFATGRYMTVDVLDVGGRTLGSAHADLDSAGGRVQVRLGQRATRLRVVDRDDQAIQDAEVCVAAPESNPVWRAITSTDSRGLAEFRGLPFERVLVALYHPAHGTRIEIPVDDSTRAGEPIEIVLDAKERIQLELRDGAVPLQGVSVRFSDRGGSYSVFEGASDANGRVEVRAVGAGEYVLAIKHPQHWPTTAKIQAATAAAQVVQVRRLGSIEFTLRNAGGAFVANAPVALRSLELDTDVADWIAAGRVAAPSQGLRTDARGTLRVDGLPRGDYRWSSGELDGTASVPPHACASVSIVAP